MGEAVREAMVMLQVFLAVYLLFPLRERLSASYLGRALRGEEGQLVEYALLILLIAIACIVALTTLGTRIRDVFTRIGNSLR
jgi:Flp pilus assembly pilin Flp